MARTSKSNEQNVGVEDPNDIARIIAQRLQEARKRAGLTQTQLGERAGVTQNYIYELEYGTTNISIRTLDKMAKALDVDIRDLIPGHPLATPSGADLEILYRTLDTLVACVTTNLAEEQRLNERELARRAQHNETLLGEIGAYKDLREKLGKLIDAQTATKKP
jgi:transcriptional regulator with XRE-family HTH domain